MQYVIIAKIQNVYDAVVILENALTALLYRLLAVILFLRIIAARADQERPARISGFAKASKTVEKDLKFNTFLQSSIRFV